MLDLKFIRDNPDKVKQAVRNKNSKVDIDELLELDNARRKLQVTADELRAKQKAFTANDREAAKVAKLQLKEVEERLTHAVKRLEEQLIMVPNIPFDDVPVGKNESDNVVMRTVGDKPKFKFEPKDYLTLAEALDIIDVKTAAEVSGTRFGYLKGAAALMEFALVQFGFSVLTNESRLKKIAKAAGLFGVSTKPFVPVVPPAMLREDVYSKMARLEPKDDRYHIPSDDLWLVGSAEHTLGPMHMNQTFEESALPIRYVGFSSAFRRESGTYGKDTKGILRVHQFDKLEMESFCLPEVSRQEQDFAVAIQEYLWQELGIPYQVINICTGDMGAPDARQIDINAWMPGQGTYRETTTADLNTDYQARRLGTKVKRGAKAEYVHMMDATVFAIGRTLIAIIENYQQADGTIEIPKILRPYMGGQKKIPKG